MDLQLKAGRDEIQYAGLILANACLGFAAVRAGLIAFRDIVPDLDLRQPSVIRLARPPWPCWYLLITGWRLRQYGDALDGVEIEQVPLPGASTSRSCRGPKT